MLQRHRELPVRHRLNRRVIPTLALILASSVAVPGAQWPTGQLRELLDKTSLHRVIDGDPPVTTGLDDALTGIDFLDRYKPSGFAPLSAQPQNSAGAFHVGPGAYHFVAESYCLHAGTHGPGGGDGYVSAPLQGPKRDAVRHILQDAVAHPEIPQQDIQVLLWAILARTRIGDMPRKTQVTAARLLTPAQLLDLNGGALGLVPDRAWREAAQSLPPTVGRAFEAEARLRQMLTTFDASFDEIERLAVLAGDPAPDPASREIPQGRWSYHPGGYFIRFFPSGYSRTEVQVYVPEPMTLVRDSAGRIAAIVDERGARFEVDYVDRATSAIGGDPDISGHAFRSIRVLQPGARSPGFRVDVNGWTAAGVPRGAAAWQTLLEQPALSGAYGARARDMRDLVDLAQLQIGLEAALNAGGNGEIRLSPVFELVARAWATAFCEQAGGCARGQLLDAAGRSRTPSRPTPTYTVDLAETVAVPGHRGRQRLGLSGRSQR